MYYSTCKFWIKMNLCANSQQCCKLPSLLHFSAEKEQSACGKAVKTHTVGTANTVWGFSRVQQCLKLAAGRGPALVHLCLRGHGTPQSSHLTAPSGDAGLLKIWARTTWKSRTSAEISLELNQTMRDRLKEKMGQDGAYITRLQTLS